jgi:hypothetical protein
MILGEKPVQSERLSEGRKPMRGSEIKIPLFQRDFFVNMILGEKFIQSDPDLSPGSFCFARLRVITTGPQ